MPPRTPHVNATLTGEELTLSCDGALVTAAGVTPPAANVTLPVTYQWRRYGVLIQDTPSAELRTYTLTRAQSRHGGAYSCIAVNEAGRRESETKTYGKLMKECEICFQVVV